jgi:hypothetical protein
MTQLPDADVRAVLERAWHDWTDPATTTSMLAAELGLDPPSAGRAPSAGRCP